jgi:hypothetical protein
LAQFELGGFRHREFLAGTGGAATNPLGYHTGMQHTGRGSAGGDRVIERYQARFRHHEAAFPCPI